jgi:hypothetical protein
MTKSPKEDRRLIRLTKICLALPEATRCTQGRHAGFLVGKKTFAYFLDDHHGDGIVAVSCKVLPGDNAALAKAQPDRFYLPAYMAHNGWVALRLDVGGWTGKRYPNWSHAVTNWWRPSGWLRW